MLSNISISNYAIIDNIDIHFPKGFSVITGETGAGKSIILGALGLILGERFDAKSANNSDKKTVIEATFDVSEYPILKSIFEENDLDYDGSQCIIRREVSSLGKSRAFINDTPVTLSTVRDISLHLVDIHSQHNNALLAEPHFQLSILDNIAGNADIKAEYISVYKEYRQLKTELEELREHIHAAESEREYNQFLFDQLCPLNLQSGEEEELEEAHRRLSNVAQIKETLWSVSNSLDNENASLIGSITTASHRLNNIASMLSQASELSERLESVNIELRDIVETINGLDAEIYDDPRELARIEDRLSTIINLKRKHSVSSVDELIQVQAQLEEKLSLVENSENEINQLRKQLIATLTRLKDVADRLSDSRAKAAYDFEASLVELAKPLGLPNIKCKFDIEAIDFTSSGCDKVELRIALNKNQPLSSLGATASGGEISRLMLCVKYLLAQRINLPTVILDEIDTGVSGEIANRMALMMRQMADKMQVITITHLPQVAAKGEHHYKVFKRDTEQSTVTSIKMLSGEERITEIAGMLGGSTIDDAAINNAVSLLNDK